MWGEIWPVPCIEELGVVLKVVWRGVTFWETELGEVRLVCVTHSNYTLLRQPNGDMARLPAEGHVVLPPASVFGMDEVNTMLAEARSNTPRWGNIFNTRPPLIPWSEKSPNCVPSCPWFIPHDVGSPFQLVHRVHSKHCLTQFLTGLCSVPAIAFRSLWIL